MNADFRPPDAGEVAFHGVGVQAGPEGQRVRVTDLHHGRVQAAQARVRAVLVA